MTFFNSAYTIEHYEEKLKKILSNYNRKVINSDGTVQNDEIYDDYLLRSDDWAFSFFYELPQFKDDLDRYQQNKKHHRYTIDFKSSSYTINLELKCLYKMRLFQGEWSIYSAFQKHTHRYRIIEFMNIYYPKYNSLLELDIDKAEIKYMNWLKKQQIPIIETINHRYGRPPHKQKTRAAKYLRAIYNALSEYVDNRIHWDKDEWKITYFKDEYDFDFNKSSCNGMIKFSEIKNEKLKNILKDYIKDRILGKRRMSWSTAATYARDISRLFNIVSPTGYEKRVLRNMSRADILKYIEMISKMKRWESSRTLNNHLHTSLGHIRTFLEDLQVLDYSNAPQKSISQIIHPDDFPKYQNSRVVNCIPDNVLKQLFDNIQDLKPDVIPVIWISFKTGLRISDTLSLKEDCLIYIQDKPYIQTSISKTKINNHKIPIDAHLEEIIEFLINKTKIETNEDNNPHRYLFVRLNGPRKGRPFLQSYIREELNTLAIAKNIRDKQGEVYRFRMHEFRHTYAVKLLNNGADIVTVQELLAHASPEMTMVYAKLLDDTKRKEFEKVMATGTFEFDHSGNIEKTDISQVNDSTVVAIWQNYKLNAVDNPYGTCLSRTNGNCPYVTEPPCLTCNNGKPCKDLAIGLSELDKDKYRLHIKSTEKLINKLKENNRHDMAEKNMTLLERYKAINQRINDDSVIYGRDSRINPLKEV